MTNWQGKLLKDLTDVFSGVNLGELNRVEVMAQNQAFWLIRFYSTGALGGGMYVLVQRQEESEQVRVAHVRLIFAPAAGLSEHRIDVSLEELQEVLPLFGIQTPSGPEFLLAYSGCQDIAAVLFPERCVIAGRVAGKKYDWYGKAAA